MLQPPPEQVITQADQHRVDSGMERTTPTTDYSDGFGLLLINKLTDFIMNSVIMHHSDVEHMSWSILTLRWVQELQ